MLVATRHSAAAYKPVPPGGPVGCSSPTSVTASAAGRCGGRCSRQYDERLGLTATLERSDDAVTELLLPYFGGICHRYGFEQAIADGVCAPPRVAFVGVALSVDERAEYIATEQQLVSARHHLRQVRDMPLEPFGDFLAAVAHLAERDAGADGRAAREYLDAFSKRRQIVAQSSGKYELLGQLAPAIREARRRAGVHRDRARREPRHQPARSARVDRPDHRVDGARVSGGRSSTTCASGSSTPSPRHACSTKASTCPTRTSAIVMSASRTRRQMIQRMGRILRRKQPGVAARFVIMFAKDTLEDPANRIERDGFLDEIERISEATGVFDSATVRGARRVPRRARPAGRSRAGASRALRARRGGSRRRAGQGFESLGDVLADEMGVEAAYAFLSFAQGDRADPRRETAIRRLDARLPRPEPDAPYLEVELADAAADREAEGQAQAAVDRTGAARDRAHRVRVADQLHRLRRSITARPVPLAGPRPDRGLPLRVMCPSGRVSRGRYVSASE